MRRAKMDYSFKYRAPIERRKIPQVAMPKKPWLLDGKAAPVKRFTPAEIQAWLAKQEGR